MMKDDEWKELMGPHLIMKTLDKSSSSSSSIPTNSRSNNNNSNDDGDDTTNTTNPVVFSEVGDVIILTVEGRILGSDSDYNFSSSDGNLKEVATSSDVYMSSPQKDEWMITMGDGDVLPAIEMACRFMSTEETCLVRCHSKYAHGSYGVVSSISSSKYFQQTVPPNTSIEFVIEIKQIIPSTKFDRALNVKRVCAKKELATQLYFMNQQYSRSIQIYYSAIKIIKYQLLLDAEGEGESNNSRNSDDSAQVKQLLVDCLNNVALCYMKLNEYIKAKETLTELLQLDPNNMKALCRAIKCCIQLSEYKEAHDLLKVAVEIMDKSPQQDTIVGDIKKLRDELRQHELSYKKKEKQMYQKMMTTNNNKKQLHPSTIKRRGQQQQQQQQQQISNDDDNDYDDKANLFETNNKKTKKDTTRTTKTNDNEEPLLPLQDLELSFRNPQFVILVVSLILALIVTKMFQIYVENNVFVDKNKPS